MTRCVRVAELVDALDSGSSGLTLIGVQFPSLTPTLTNPVICYVRRYLILSCPFFKKVGQNCWQSVATSISQNLPNVYIVREQGFIFVNQSRRIPVYTLCFPVCTPQNKDTDAKSSPCLREKRKFYLYCIRYNFDI